MNDITEVTTDPRLLPGDNKPPLAERLPIDYAAELATVETIAAAATNAPKEITTDDEHAALVKIVKDARTIGKTLKSHFEKEKAPHLEAGRTVDTFFKKPRERMDSVVTAMEKRIKVRLDAIAAAEQARIAEEARQAREKERLAREEAERQLREAAATKPGNSDVRETRMIEAAASTAVAKAHETEARSLEIAATAKPAELARTRTEEGLSTLATFIDYEITDIEAVSLVKLRPFIKHEHIEQAIRAFVKTHGEAQTLPGVRIFRNTRANVR